MSEPLAEWPFDLWLKTAVRSFGLTPAAFWDMSMRDWLALMAGQTEHGFARPDLSDLMKHYPDEEIK